MENSFYQNKFCNIIYPDATQNGDRYLYQFLL